MQWLGAQCDATMVIMAVPLYEWFVVPAAAAIGGSCLGLILLFVCPSPPKYPLISVVCKLARATNVVIAVPVSLYLAAFMPFNCKTFNETYFALETLCFWGTWLMPFFVTTGLFAAERLSQFRKRALALCAGGTWIWYPVLLVAWRSSWRFQACRAERKLETIGTSSPVGEECDDVDGPYAQ